jgi:membrane-associated protease RseP (regulator of RpoE activity)
MTDSDLFYAAWRSVALDDQRMVCDGLIREEHRGPSPALTRFLLEWKGRWYWGDDERHRLILIEGAAIARPERWLWHGALLALFVLCTLGAGAVIDGRLHPASPPGLAGVITGSLDFVRFLAAGGWRVLPQGWEFGAPLLGILLVHELGHYLAARRYAIDVSPPYFIPVPPNLSPIGGLGAFIRLRSPVYDRRQLLDVGASGPLAGFVAAVVVLVWGLHLSHRVPVGALGDPSFVRFAGTPILLGDSLLTRGLREWIVGGTGSVLLAPQAFAGWVGLFITGLNLLPLSQLDGGHVWFGLLGKSQRWLAMAVAAGLLLLGTRAPMWYLWAGLTFAIGGGRWGHPAVLVPDRGVLRYGRLVGLGCIIVFVLTFVPIPFRS